MSSYALNPALAREGAGSIGGRIRETGKYTGVIEWAREVKFDTGSVAVEFKFRSTEDQTTQFKLFVTSKAGNGDSYGLKQLNALMTCTKLRGINSVRGSVEVYDFDKKEIVLQPSEVFPEFAGKPVGLLLQKEIYEYEGKLKDQINLFAPFSLDTEQTAREILDGKGERDDIPKLLDALKDKHRGAATVQAKTHAQPAQAAADFDDDIPF